MDSQPLGETLHYLRRITGAGDDSRLDAELLERFVAARDEAAFAELVERYGPLVLGVCRRVLGNHHDAEDAFQATFLVLARKAGQIRRRDALAAWLYKVAFQLSVKLRASSERRRQAEGEMPVAREQPRDEITWADLRLVLDEELDRLPEKYRAPLLLCCLDGRTRDEAAGQLGWTLATLKMRLERGRQMLRARLERRGLTVSVTLLAMLLAQNAAATPVPAVLAATTFKAAVLFAAGTTCASLPGGAVRLASLSAGAGKGKVLGAVALLLGLIGLAVGALASFRSPEPPRPLLPAGEGTAADAPRPADGAFVDATEESGLGELLRRHYAAFPEWEPSGATLLDLHGDGRLDLHLAGQSEDLAALGRNTGGRFAYVDPRPDIRRGPRHWDDVPYPGGQIRHAFDFNEDGRLDLAVSWHNNGAALYYRAAPRDGLRYRRAKFVEPEFLEIRASALADVDGDGVVDFLTSDNDGGLAVHLGIGDGTFSSAPNAVISTGLRSAGAIPVDLDGDGQPELIARQTAFDLPARRKIFRRIAPLKWADVTRECGLSEEGSVHGVGDLNRDGHPDLICMEGGRIVLYLNDGKGRFTRKADAVRGLERASNRPHEEWGDQWGGAVVADFDNDGVPDILINGKCFLYLLRGNGDGTFEYVNDRWGLPDFAYCDVNDGLCFGDVDGDGRLDLVVAASPPDYQRRPIALYRNQLPPRHWLRVQLVGKAGNRSATGAKIRLYEAGKPDRLLASEQVTVWGRESFHSYYAARRTERHFGLGQCPAVDVSVEFYPSGARVVRTNVPADAVVEIAETVR
jgi:RNA polymerase sigma factor (sigma-70 family)